DVARRTREIGIRIALGATRGDVARLVLIEGARTAAVGLGVGLLLAAGIGELARGMLYRVSPFDPLVLTVAVVVLAAATMAACDARPADGCAAIGMSASVLPRDNR